MSEDNKKVLVEIDEDLYEKIKEYSRCTNQSEKQIVNRLFEHTLRDFEKKYANLKQGYQDMAKINLEISSAFTVSENEALSYVKYIED